VLYGGWWIMSAEERRLPDIVAEVPERLQRLVDFVALAREAVVVRLPRGDSANPAGSSTASAAPPAAAPPMPMVAAVPTSQPLAQPASPLPVTSLPDAPPADEPEAAELSDEDESARPAPESTAQLPASPAAAPSPVVEGTPSAVAALSPPAASDSGVGRIILRAREENWVQVRDGTNAPVMTRVLKPGDILKVPDRAGLTLMTGNAGGLDIVVDGETVPSLGASGQVRRNVALDAEKLKAGTAIGRP
jgi:cytoskeleton protein RodZ